MKLSQETIKHLAELARLSLKPSEVKRYRRELGQVLEHVGQLSQLQSAIIQTDVRLANIWRDDEPIIWPKSETKLALDQAGAAHRPGCVQLRVLCRVPRDSGYHELSVW